MRSPLNVRSPESTSQAGSLISLMESSSSGDRSKNPLLRMRYSE
jgi:hypothetical protein